MGVDMDGATSGDKYNYLPDISRPYDKQVPQNTATNSCTSNINWGPQPTGNREADATAPMPCNGTPDPSAI
jgi:hypothetical protein